MRALVLTYIVAPQGHLMPDLHKASIALEVA